MVPDSRCKVAGRWLIHGLNYFMKYSYSLQGSICIHFFHRKKKNSFLTAPFLLFPQYRENMPLSALLWLLHHALYDTDDSLFRNFNTWKSGKARIIYGFLGICTLLRGNIQIIYDHALFSPLPPGSSFPS